MHRIELASEPDKIRMIVCLAIIFTSNLPFFVFLTHSVWLLSPVPTFSLIYFLFFQSVRAILLSAALVRETPARLKYAVHHAVKVIGRRARERTIEKTIHTYKYILRIFIEHYL